MTLVAPMRQLPAGQLVRLVATDPAAPVDIPAWCHLTGHEYVRPGVEPDGRPHYLLKVSQQAAQTRDGKPWRRMPPPIRQTEGTTS